MGSRELLDAVTEQRWSEARRLIESNIGLEYRTAQGLTPLMMALLHGREDIARALIEKGADVNAAETASTGFTCLHLACKAGLAEIVRLLIQKGARVNTPDYGGITPADVAAHQGYAEIADILRQPHAEGK